MDNNLFQGYTKTEFMDMVQLRAFQALGKVQDAIGAAGYMAWYSMHIPAGAGYSEIANICDVWLADSCHHCHDATCACKSTNQDIPF